jgi:hypothetical protein
MKLNKSHTLSFCYDKRLKLRELIRIIESRLGLSRFLVIVPWRIAYVLLLMREKLLGISKVRADSVLDFAHPADMAFGRGFFARMIERFRFELEMAAHADGESRGFYFLEEAGTCIARKRPCNAKNIGPDAIAALGRLPKSERNTLAAASLPRSA